VGGSRSPEARVPPWIQNVSRTRTRTLHGDHLESSGPKHYSRARQGKWPWGRTPARLAGPQCTARCHRSCLALGSCPSRGRKTSCPATWEVLLATLSLVSLEWDWLNSQSSSKSAPWFSSCKLSPREQP
jgi:hypothetical protein